MKKTTFFLLLVATLAVGEAPAADLLPTPYSELASKPRRKAPRKKKGFMWGLFRRNDCGCPKH